MKLGDYIFEYSQRNKEDKSYPVYSVTNTLGFCQEYFSKDVSGKDKTTYKLVPRGYFAYNPSRINVGSVDWQKTEDCVIVSPLYVVFGLKDTLKPEYLKYYLKSKPTNELIRLSTSGTVRDNLKYSTLEKFPIPVPSIEEQTEICSLLDKLNQVIEAKKEQITELDKLAQSLFYDMFGDPITNEKSWNVKTLKDVGEIITGSTPSTKNAENYNSSDFCFVKPSDIDKDSITRISKTEFYISKSAYNNSRKLPKGSVLVTCIGIVGKTGILEVDATCNQQINAIIPNAYCNSLYIAYSVLLSKRIIEAMANAPVVPIINKGEFSKISIPVPPLPLQQAFAEKVQAIERQKELINQSIKDVQTLFDAKMDYYFGD